MGSRMLCREDPINLNPKSNKQQGDREGKGVVARNVHLWRAIVKSKTKKKPTLPTSSVALTDQSQGHD